MMINNENRINYVFMFRNIFVFLFFFIIILFYQSKSAYDNLFLVIFLSFFIIFIFIVAIFKIKIALYIFIFTVPLFNSLTTILEVRSAPIPLILFFSLFLGFLTNKFSNPVDKKDKIDVPGTGILLERNISIAIFLFVLILTISCAITIFKYSNFYPFITNKFYNLFVNVNKMDALSAIYWTINSYLNLIIGFGLLLIVFNALEKLKDIILAILSLVISTIVSSIMLFYQAIINPFIGSFRYWVEAGRLNATFTDPNSLGAYVLLLFPIFFVLIFYFKKWYLKLLILLAFIPFLFMVFYSGSRSAFLTIVLALIIFIVIWLVKFIKYIKNNFIYFSTIKKIFIFLSLLIIFMLIISTIWSNVFYR